MMVIRAVSFKGQPIGGQLAARFTESGGTIGRGESSVLMLPDPDRYISRTHAIISFQAGGFVITDNGTKNPIILNGRPMGPGSQARLSDGDEIKLGGYVLEVSLAAQRAPQVAAGEIPVAREPVASPIGPLPIPSDPFADLLRPAPPRPAPPSGNWPGSAPAVTPAPQSLPPDPLAGLHGKDPKVDDLLGLKPSGVPDLLAPDAPLGRSLLEQESSRAVDPLELLGGSARSVSPSTAPSDRGHEVFTHFIPPAARVDPAVEIRPEPAAPVVAPLPSPAPSPVPSPVLDARPSMDPRPVPSPAPMVSLPADASLLQAFLEGAGIADARLPSGLTPELMRMVGALLREAVQGTLDLLRVRGLMKSEMRADVTMIMPTDNNPLKFSPTAEAALLQLLSPQGHGFTPPLPAMQNAYADLRAHQLGVLAGMRAALEEVLARFSPEELQRRLADASMLDSVLPINRKAKQWDLFVERYEEVASDAREDFNAAFGKAFRRAYEAQVKQLRDTGRS
jgi:FHA domain-containing protein